MALVVAQLATGSECRGGACRDLDEEEAWRQMKQWLEAWVVQPRQPVATPLGQRIFAALCAFLQLARVGERGRGKGANPREALINIMNGQNINLDFMIKFIRCRCGNRMRFWLPGA